MTAAPIQARHLREEDLGAIVSIPKYEMWTGRLDGFRHEGPLTFITIDDFQREPFEHVLRGVDRIELDSLSEERIAMSADRRLAVLEGRALAKQAAMFRTIRNEREGDL